jgi:hypothetical protein
MFSIIALQCCDLGTQSLTMYVLLFPGKTMAALQDINFGCAQRGLSPAKPAVWKKQMFSRKQQLPYGSTEAELNRVDV